MKKHYHFIGIGGSGMGPLASLMLAKGHKVSGSDIKTNTVTDHLSGGGAEVYIGHDAKHVNGADYVVFSSAINHENPEFMAAQSRRIPILQRAQLLSQLMSDHLGITIAGAHGKTTTTSMISHLLMAAGLGPTTAIGGLINGASSNANLGNGQYFVAEVDESDGSFLFFTPKYSVITNIDFEHVDYYQNWDKILEAYRQFIDQTSEGGTLVICGEDDKLRQLSKESQRDFITYGLTDEFDVYAESLAFNRFSSSFDCFVRGEKIGRVELSVPGRHNILNALACIALGSVLSIDFAIILQSLHSYRGVQRRFQLKGDINGIVVVDDYGHHPTEIRNTIETAKSFKKNRVITVFQPHRYSRTKFLQEEFIDCLSLSDYLIITDIYTASEKKLEGVTAQNLCELIKKNTKNPVVYLEKEKIIDHLHGLVSPGDLVLTLGAGDIYRVADDLVQNLERKYKDQVQSSQ